MGWLAQSGEADALHQRVKPRVPLQIFAQRHVRREEHEEGRAFLKCVLQRLESRVVLFQTRMQTIPRP
jgi:hypothetical protein